MLTWLDLFMEVAGSGKILDKILIDIKPKIDEVENRLYPTILKLEEFQKRWEQLSKTFNDKQKFSLKKYDYAYLEPEQMFILHNKIIGKFKKIFYIQKIIRKYFLLLMPKYCGFFF